MTRVWVREVQKGDAEEVLANLRPQDRAEIQALLGPGRERPALIDGMRSSSLLWTCTSDDGVLAIFGVAPINILTGRGAPWLLGTPLIDKHRRAFIRLNPPYIARMLALYPTLLNIVDTRNVKSIAWLKRMGFRLYPAQALGKEGQPFHPFVMGALDV